MRSALALGGVALLLTACPKAESPEGEIRNLVLDAAAAVAEHDTSAVVAPLAEDFCGARLRRGAPRVRARSPGAPCPGADREAVRRAVMARLLPRGWIRVFVRRLDVEVEGPSRAEAVLDAVIARGEPVERLEDLLPTQADELLLELDLERRSEGWRIVGGRFR